MGSERARFFKNAASNIVTGASSAVFAIVLPYFFVRYFTRAEFGIWVLVLQLAAYVNYLTFGVQVAVGRYISHAMETNDQPQAERILTAGVQILSALALLGFVVIIGLTWGFPRLFHQVAPGLVPTAQSALLWVGGALAFGLPFSAFLGVFVGLQRNDIPAALAAISKTALAVVLIVTAAQSRDLKTVALIYFVGNMVLSFGQYGVFLWLCKQWYFSVMRRVATEVRELTSYCTGLMVWYLSMFLVNGVDTTIVGFFDFRMVAAYGAAISIVSFFAGLIQALMAPLIQIFAKLHARGEADRMMRLLHISSFCCTSFLLVSATWLITLAEPAFSFWVGTAIAKDAVPLFDLLIVATVVRNSATPYANYLVATGQQRRVLLGPIIEGGANLVASIAGAHFFGSYGVAMGTLLGALAGVVTNYTYNFRRTMPPRSSLYNMVRANYTNPILLSSFAIAVMAARAIGLLSVTSSIFLLVLGSCPALFAALQLAFLPSTSKKT